MGQPQSVFLEEFKAAFHRQIDAGIIWSGGQGKENTAGFAKPFGCRRNNGKLKAERFELGDLSAVYHGWKIIIEFENKEVPLSNLLKYWPYLRGELADQPDRNVLICHFSDWWSYATRRDLWEWTLARIKADPGVLFAMEGRQFDHWGQDADRRAASISDAIAWIDQTVRA